MYMKDNEIVREYREAKDKKEQVKILADMNQSTYDEIVEVLRKKGIDVTGVERKKKGKQGTKESTQKKAVPVEEQKPALAAEQTPDNPLAAGLPEIVKDTITMRMMAETEKMEEYQRQIKECEQNIQELNAFLQKCG